MPDNSVSRQTPRAVLDYSAHERAQRKAPYMVRDYAFGRRKNGML